MTFGVRFLDEAEADLIEASGYYGTSDPAIGIRFVDCVVDSLYELVDFPERCLEILPGIRQLVLRPFPYCVYYAVEPEELLVIAVIGSMRDPAFIDRLLSDRSF